MSPPAARTNDGCSSVRGEVAAGRSAVTRTCGAPPDASCGARGPRHAALSRPDSAIPRAIQPAGNVIACVADRRLERTRTMFRDLGRARTKGTTSANRSADLDRLSRERLTDHLFRKVASARSNIIDNNSDPDYGESRENRGRWFRVRWFGRGGLFR